MKEHDFKDLGVKAQGHVIKFRDAIVKLMKINERQKRNKRLKRQLNIQTPRKDSKPTENIIRWDTTAVDEMESGSQDGGADDPSLEGSNASRKSTTKTVSSSSSDRRRLGSIDISVSNLPKRKSSDNPLERRRSNESVLSLDKLEAKKEAKSPSTAPQLPQSPSQLASSCWAVYDSSRPTIRRTMSMIKEDDPEEPSASISFEPEFNAPEKKSASNK